MSPAPIALEAALPDPTTNIPPSPDFVDNCSATTYDESLGCLLSVLFAIDNARATLGLPPMTLPTNWLSLSPTEQLFVATNLERTVRGLAPLSALDSELDSAAAQGVTTETDPVPPPGLSWTQWGGNWIDDIGNPLEALYFWMYDDGLGSGNVDCTAADTSGCWSHWRNVTLPLACTQCLMGAAWGQSTQGAVVATQLIVETDSSLTTVFTWAQEQAFLP
jgi:hypothetical protein